MLLLGCVQSRASIPLGGARLACEKSSIGRQAGRQAGGRAGGRGRLSGTELQVDEKYRPRTFNGEALTRMPAFDASWFRIGARKISKLGPRIAWVSGNEGVLHLAAPEVQRAYQAVSS